MKSSGNVKNKILQEAIIKRILSVQKLNESEKWSKSIRFVKTPSCGNQRPLVLSSMIITESRLSPQGWNQNRRILQDRGQLQSNQFTINQWSNYLTADLRQTVEICCLSAACWISPIIIHAHIMSSYTTELFRLIQISVILMFKLRSFLFMSPVPLKSFPWLQLSRSAHRLCLNCLLWSE